MVLENPFSEMGKDDKSERNITDADRKCPENLISNRENLSAGQLKPLEEGTIIGKKWKVIKQIDAERGFNTTYVVENRRKGYQASLKIEQRNAAIPLLRFELFILLQMEHKNKAKQFCKVFDRGQTDAFNWIVITLCGKDLKTLRKEQPEGKLTPACGFSVASQCLNALESLHKLGFIHRSVNPSDFAIGHSLNGATKELRSIYLLDFGFARQYLEADGQHKPPRPKPWVYKGSARYAPRSAHLAEEMSRLDDMEMWFYMTVELVKGALPWVGIRDSKLIFEQQKSVRSGLSLKKFLGGLPTETITIMKEIDRLQYKEEPNYTNFYKLLDACIQKTGQPFPYDWETNELAEAKTDEGGSNKTAVSFEQKSGR